MKLFRMLSVCLLAWSFRGICGEPSPTSWLIPTPKILKRTDAVPFKGSEYPLKVHDELTKEKVMEFRLFLKEKMNWNCGKAGKTRMEIKKKGNVRLTKKRKKESYKRKK